MVGQTMPPKDFHILIIGPCKYDLQNSQRDFVDMIKLRFFRWRNEPGLSKWVQGHFQVLRGVGGQDLRDVITKQIWEREKGPQAKVGM